MNLKLIALTTLTMVAFAANSIFCRLALFDSANSPVSFTLLRLLSGAILLLFFFFKVRSSESKKPNAKNSLAAITLFAYALFFSLAYVQLNTGTGALILFASVQLTMMVASFVQGHTMNKQETIGIILALSGFIYLLLPGITMPPIVGAAFMCLSGISWGIYSLLGQGSKNSVFSTARNFLFTLPLIILLALVHNFQLTHAGIIWAILSGGITSGLGYVLWYTVLKDLKTSTAAIVQLSVPVIAALGGVIFLSEVIHLRLVIAGCLIFSGIYLKVKPTSLIK